jgi:hypothetical protein
MKNKLYIFIIIIIGILTLIFMQMSNNRELFVLGDSQNFNYRNIDRMDNDNHTYSYCIGGRITCNKAQLDSVPIEVTNSSDAYYGGKTYKPYCMTNGVEDKSNTVFCDGTIFSKMNLRDMSSNTLPKSNFAFPISSVYLGMTQPYSYVPAAIDATNKNKLNFMKNQNGDIVEYMDICDVYFSTDQDNCKRKLYGSINSNTIIGNVYDVSYQTIDVKYDPSLWNSPVTMEQDNSAFYPTYNSNNTGTNNVTNNVTNTTETNTDTETNIDTETNTAESITSSITSTTSSITSTTSSITSTTSSKKLPPTDCKAKIPCVADFGSNIGDTLCCGQPGVLLNTNNICPATKPKCGNFDCKTQLGYCQ